MSRLVGPSVWTFTSLGAPRGLRDRAAFAVHARASGIPARRKNR